MSQKARSFEKEGDGKPCFSDAELACRLALQGRRQLLLGSNAAVTRCLRRVFLRSSSIKLASSDVSDSISLSQAVQLMARRMHICACIHMCKEICSISSQSRVLAHRPCPKLEMFCPSVLQLSYGCSKVLMTNQAMILFLLNRLEIRAQLP